MELLDQCANVRADRPWIPATNRLQQSFLARLLSQPDLTPAKNFDKARNIDWLARAAPLSAGQRTGRLIPCASAVRPAILGRSQLRLGCKLPRRLGNVG